jgi:hypothetical protein
VVDDRHDVGEALARAGAGGQDVVAAAAGAPDGLLLVEVQPQRPALAEPVGLDAEDLAAPLVQDPLVGQLVDPAAGLERGVELEQRLGPEQLGVEFLLDPAADRRVADLDEAADVGGVGGDQALAQLEDVQGPLPESPLVTLDEQVPSVTVVDRLPPLRVADAGRRDDSGCPPGLVCGEALWVRRESTPRPSIAVKVAPGGHDGGTGHPHFIPPASGNASLGRGIAGRR